MRAGTIAALVAAACIQNAVSFGQARNAAGKTSAKAPASAPGKSAKAANTASPKPAAASSPRTISADPSEETIRTALAALYGESRSALRDMARGSTAGSIDGDSLRYLAASVEPDREAALSMLESTAAEASKSMQSRFLLSLGEDEVYAFKALDKENRFNKVSRVFNRASSGVAKLALLQPGEAIAMMIDAAQGGLANRAATTRERLMLRLAQQFVEKYPQAGETPELRNAIEELTARLRRDRIKWRMERGQSHLERGNPELALFHFESAQALADPSDEVTTKAVNLARAAEKELELRREANVSVGTGEDALPDGKRTELESLARDLTARRVPSQLSSLPDADAYAAAAAAARNGNPLDAIQRLADLSAKLGSSPEQRAAAQAVANPGWNLAARWDDALARLEFRRQRFLVTGNRSADDTAFAAAQAAATSPVSAPALFATDLLVRGMSEGFRSPVNTDEAEDAAAAYLRRFPSGPRAPEIAGKLAALVRRTGDARETLEVLNETGGATPEQRAKLRESMARDGLVMALESDNLASRRQALLSLATEYGDTKSGKKAAERLQELPPLDDAGAIPIPPGALRGNADFANATGLPPVYIDGSRSNGEVSAEGVVIASDGSRVVFRVGSKEPWQTLSIPKANRRAVLALARKLGQDAAFGQSAEDSLTRRRLPVGVEGGIGGRGVDVSPRLLPYEDQPNRDRYYQR